jgi:hypothetical protein
MGGQRQQDLVDMTQHGLSKTSPLDRPRGHVHEDDEEDVSRARRRIRWRIATSHGIAWSHLDEQIHTDSRTSDDFWPHFASMHADLSNLAVPFIYLIPYALKDGTLACTNAAIADAAQHVDLLERNACYAFLVLIFAHTVSLRRRGGWASAARSRAGHLRRRASQCTSHGCTWERAPPLAS